MGGRPFSKCAPKPFICRQCGQEHLRATTRQFYCPACSEMRHRERQRAWAQAHPTSPQVWRRSAERKKTITTENGLAISAANRSGICDPAHPDLEWLVRFRVPYSRASSKNYIYGLTGPGHVIKRDHIRAWRSEIAAKVREATHDRKIVQHKVWLDLFIQKPNHKIDAVNVIDHLCDAIKEGIGVDDRWFAIYRLDWEIVKESPEIFIGIGQTANEDHQSCGSCGRILTFNAFGKKTHSLNGIERNCRDCRRGKAA